jgi:hypothetical protein
MLGVRGESLGIVVDQTQNGLAFTPEGSSELHERIRLLQVGLELRKQLGSNSRNQLSPNGIGSPYA